MNRRVESTGFEPWEIGLITAATALVVMVVLALVYRILTILIGDQLTQLLLALAVLVGVVAGLLATVIQTVDRRERAGLQRQATEEGRSL